MAGIAAAERVLNKECDKILNREQFYKDLQHTADTELAQLKAGYCERHSATIKSDRASKNSNSKAYAWRTLRNSPDPLNCETVKETATFMYDVYYSICCSFGRRILRAFMLIIWAILRVIVDVVLGVLKLVIGAFQLIVKLASAAVGLAKQAVTLALDALGEVVGIDGMTDPETGYLSIPAFYKWLWAFVILRIHSASLSGTFGVTKLSYDCSISLTLFNWDMTLKLGFSLDFKQIVLNFIDWICDTFDAMFSKKGADAIDGEKRSNGKHLQPLKTEEINDDGMTPEAKKAFEDIEMKESSIDEKHASLGGRAFSWSSDATAVASHGSVHADMRVRVTRELRRHAIASAGVSSHRNDWSRVHGAAISFLASHAAAASMRSSPLFGDREAFASMTNRYHDFAAMGHVATTAEGTHAAQAEADASSHRHIPLTAAFGRARLSPSSAIFTAIDDHYDNADAVSDPVWAVDHVGDANTVVETSLGRGLRAEHESFAAAAATAHGLLTRHTPARAALHAWASGGNRRPYMWAQLLSTPATSAEYGVPSAAGGLASIALGTSAGNTAREWDAACAPLAEAEARPLVSVVDAACGAVQGDFASSSGGGRGSARKHLAASLPVACRAWLATKPGVRLTKMASALAATAADHRSSSAGVGATLGDAADHVLGVTRGTLAKSPALCNDDDEDHMFATQVAAIVRSAEHEPCEAAGALAAVSCARAAVERDSDSAGVTASSSSSKYSSTTQQCVKALSFLQGERCAATPRAAACTAKVESALPCSAQCASRMAILGRSCGSFIPRMETVSDMSNGACDADGKMIVEAQSACGTSGADGFCARLLEAAPDGVTAAAKARGAKSFAVVDWRNQRARGLIPASAACVSKPGARIDLHGNNFVGTVPACAWAAESNPSIHLSNNRLTGQVGSVGQHVSHLSIHGNKFSGLLTPGLRSAGKLQTIHASDNHFVGGVHFLKGKSQMRHLHVRNNRLADSPAEPVVDLIGEHAPHLQSYDIGRNAWISAHHMATAGPKTVAIPALGSHARDAVRRSAAARRTVHVTIAVATPIAAFCPNCDANIRRANCAAQESCRVKLNPADSLHHIADPTARAVARSVYAQRHGFPAYDVEHDLVSAAACVMRSHVEGGGVRVEGTPRIERSEPLGDEITLLSFTVDLVGGHGDAAAAARTAVASVRHGVKAGAELAPRAGDDITCAGAASGSRSIGKVVSVDARVGCAPGRLGADCEYSCMTRWTRVDIHPRPMDDGAHFASLLESRLPGSRVHDENTNTAEHKSVRSRRRRLLQPIDDKMKSESVESAAAGTMQVQSIVTNDHHRGVHVDRVSRHNTHVFFAASSDLGMKSVEEVERPHRLEHALTRCTSTCRGHAHLAVESCTAFTNTHDSAHAATTTSRTTTREAARRSCREALKEMELQCDGVSFKKTCAAGHASYTPARSQTEETPCEVCGIFHHYAQHGAFDVGDVSAGAGRYRAVFHEAQRKDDVAADYARKAKLASTQPLSPSAIETEVFGGHGHAAIKAQVSARLSAAGIHGDAKHAHTAAFRERLDRATRSVVSLSESASSSRTWKTASARTPSTSKAAAAMLGGAVSFSSSRESAANQALRERMDANFPQCHAEVACSGECHVAMVDAMDACLQWVDENKDQKRPGCEENLAAGYKACSSKKQVNDSDGDDDVTECYAPVADGFHLMGARVPDGYAPPQRYKKHID